MTKVRTIDREGTAHILEARPGSTLMETLRDAGLPVEAICGGCCSCGTCHVYVDPAWLERTGPRDDAEDQLLQMAEHIDQTRSRLGCQIPMTESLDGLVVTLAPEE